MFGDVPNNRHQSRSLAGLKSKMIACFNETLHPIFATNERLKSGEDLWMMKQLVILFNCPDTLFFRKNDGKTLPDDLLRLIAIQLMVGGICHEHHGVNRTFPIDRNRSSLSRRAS